MHLSFGFPRFLMCNRNTSLGWEFEISTEVQKINPLNLTKKKYFLKCFWIFQVLFQKPIKFVVCIWDNQVDFRSDYTNWKRKQLKVTSENQFLFDNLIKSNDWIPWNNKEVECSSSWRCQLCLYRFKLLFRFFFVIEWKRNRWFWRIQSISSRLAIGVISKSVMSFSLFFVDYRSQTLEESFCSNFALEAIKRYLTHISDSLHISIVPQTNWI